MANKCVFCGGSPTTREHVIGKGVLKEVFGHEIKNISHSIRTGEQLIDHQQTIKDLCAKCNNHSLAQYDSEGITFLKNFNNIYDAERANLNFNINTLGWIIKTHLNHIRLFKDKRTDQPYSLNRVLIQELIEGKIHSFSKFQLYAEGWQGRDYFWDPDSPKRIPFFSYKSVSFIRQEIIGGYDWENDEDGIFYHNDKKVSPNWVIGQLWNCTDIMPSSLCEDLELHSGSTYAKGARILKEQIALQA